MSYKFFFLSVLFVCVCFLSGCGKPLKGRIAEDMKPLNIRIIKRQDKKGYAVVIEDRTYTKSKKLRKKLEEALPLASEVHLVDLPEDPTGKIAKLMSVITETCGAYNKKQINIKQVIPKQSTPPQPDPGTEKKQ